MTVADTSRKAGPFDGNGVTTNFPFDFKVFAKTDVRVVRSDLIGVEADLVLDSDYTVALNADQDATPGGTVLYAGPPVLPAGWRLVILGSTPDDQVTDITNVGRFNPDVIERTLDRTTIQIQQLKESITRTVQVPPTSSIDPKDLLQNLTIQANEVFEARDQVVDIAAHFSDEANARLDEIEAEGNVILDNFSADGTNRLNQFSTDAANQLSTNAQLASAQRLDIQSDANAMLAALGYQVPVAYTAGLQMSSPSQTVSYGGDTYAPIKSELPFITSGVFEVTKFRLIQGVSGADLAATFGSNMVGFIQEGPNTVLQPVQDKLRETGYTPYDVGAVGDGVADDTVALQRWADNINALDVRYARCEGLFKVSGNLSWVFGQEKRIDFNARINATHTSDGYIVSVTGSRLCTLAGRLVVAGGGGPAYATRTNGEGILLDGVFHNALDVVEARNVRHWGVTIRSDSDFSTFTKINRLHNYLCGTSGTTDNGLSANFSARADTGASGVPSQRSELTVDVLPSIIEAQDFLSYAGRPYVVTAVDRPNLKISVWPWLPIGITSGAIIYGVGGGLRSSGADSAGLCIGIHTTSACGNGHQNRALYSGNTGYFSAEFNEVAMSLGGADSNATIGGRVGVLYVEGNRANFVKSTVFADTSYEIGPRVDSSSGANDFYLMPRLSTDTFTTALARGGLSMMHPKGFQVDSAQFGRISGANTVTLSLGGGGAPVHLERKNSATITLNAPAMAANVGHTASMVGFIGTGTGSTPTGIFVFQPEAGYTVNGGASASFSAFSGPALFYIVLVGTDWKVVSVSAASVLAASATYDPPSLAPDATATTTIAVTGAVLGDFASVSFSVNLNGIDLTSWVSATGVVSVKFSNRTGSTQDLASGTLRVRVTSRF